MITQLKDLFSPQAYAANEIVNTSLPSNIQAMTPATGLAFYIAVLWRSVVTLGGVAFIIFLIWGGIEWLTAGGDKTRVETAQKMISNAVIGIAVLVASYAIALFFQNALKINILAPVFPNNITQ
jgi:hypothetical protein